MAKSLEELKEGIQHFTLEQSQLSVKILGDLLVLTRGDLTNTQIAEVLEHIGDVLHTEAASLRIPEGEVV